MNVRNCRSCRRLFNYIAGPALCPACREKMEEKFQEVKEYIRDNPHVTIPEVSEACDVDPQQIRQWLREDRLELTEESSIMLNCESCGAMIRSGKLCDKCKTSLANGFRDAVRKDAPKEPEVTKKNSSGSKMRFLK